MNKKSKKRDSYQEPRTFGDLMRLRPWTFGSSDNQCRECHRFGAQCPRGGVWKYSTRHYICDDCIAPRVNEVLPEVSRREKFRKKFGFVPGSAGGSL